MCRKPWARGVAIDWSRQPPRGLGHGDPAPLCRVLSLSEDNFNFNFNFNFNPFVPTGERTFPFGIEIFRKPRTTSPTIGPGPNTSKTDCSVEIRTAGPLSPPHGPENTPLT